MELTTGEPPRFIDCPMCGKAWDAVIVPVAPMADDDFEDRIAVILARDPVHVKCAEALHVQELGAVD